MGAGCFADLPQIAVVHSQQPTIILSNPTLHDRVAVNRQEAIDLIREINEECKSIRGTSIMLKTPSETDIHSKGYQVHLIMPPDPTKLQCLQIVATQYGYKVETIPERTIVIIYKPPRPMKLPGGGMA
jgi:hypothetical protein